jgi:hypothetical protein
MIETLHLDIALNHLFFIGAFIVLKITQYRLFIEILKLWQ